MDHTLRTTHVTRTRNRSRTLSTRCQGLAFVCILFTWVIAAVAQGGPRTNDALRVDLHRPGSPTVRTLPNIELNASGVYRQGGLLFVEVPYSDSSEGILVPDDTIVQGQKGFAAREGQRSSSSAEAFLVRLVSASSVNDAFTLTVRGRLQPNAVRKRKRGSDPLVKTSIRVRVPPGVPTKPELPARWAEAASRHFRTGRTPFHAFAAARVMKMHGTQKAQSRFDMPRRRPKVAESMNLLIGLEAVDEALQHRRGLNVRTDESPSQSIPVSSIEGVSLADHPWSDMIARLPEGMTPKVEPLASVAPIEFAYLHVNDPRELSVLSDQLDTLLTPLNRATSAAYGSQELVARYQDQLMLERSDLSKKIGHLAADGVALMTSSPYFGDGTDLTLVFLEKNPAILNSAMALYETRAAQKHGLIKTQSKTVNGHSVTLKTSADGVVRQYRLRHGRFLVISNNQAAMGRVIKTIEGRHPALGTAPEYQYFRAHHPYDRNSESGYLFISDAFVRHVVGPRQKILQARRMQARADLQTVGFAALLYGHLQGRAELDVQELIASGVLESNDLIHRDGAEITLGANGARSRWGTLAGLTPLLDHSLSRVSRVEKEAYERFKRGYSRNWDAFMDPIGVRILRTAHGIDVEARMMPLIKHSRYNTWRRLVGESRVAVPANGQGFRVSLGIGEDARIRGQLEWDVVFWESRV